MLLAKQPCIYLLICLFSGLSGSFISPLLSLYLIEALGVSPLTMGFFMTCMVLSGVLVSQFVAKKSDAGLSRKRIILTGQSGFMVTTIILALTQHYYTALLAVIFFMSLNAAAAPQIFTMGRSYADKHLGDKALVFVSMMRAAMALSWVIGPPLAFLINDLFSFQQTFLIAGFFSASAFITVLKGLPDIQIEKAASNAESVQTGNWLNISGVLLFLISMFFVFSANNMYITSISLYITQELNFDAKWVGYFMGIAAFIEIPIMLSAGYLAPRIGSARLIYIACISGIIFYSGLLFAEQIWHFMLLQLFNGLFIGINASLGMLVVQDMMKKQMGMASTLFNNSLMLSGLSSSLMVGLIAEYISYQAVYMAAALFCLIGLLFMCFAQKAQQKPEAEFVQAVYAE
ncbi:sugar efflux transporter [Psychromonas ossibalaenae]|uniref:sugar efflux transporter n=1 Tax=Psychromonas ossibalaenae TaxID=444922 RepID=UPI000374BEDF|nr:sugar efflux transporter [Psychromonas ossibalaenae]